MSGRTRMDDSTTEWLTYEQAAERLHVSPAAVRARALRGGWRRQPGNDGKARVLIPKKLCVRPLNSRANSPANPQTLNL